MTRTRQERTYEKSLSFLLFLLSHFLPPFFHVLLDQSIDQKIATFLGQGVLCRDLEGILAGRPDQAPCIVCLFRQPLALPVIKVL
jgi:hypothetical protein